MEPRPSIKYHWELAVYQKKTNARVIHKTYADQTFEGASIEGGRISFEDEVPLLAGEYRVDVRLNRLPNTPSEALDHNCELRGFETVTVRE